MPYSIEIIVMPVDRRGRFTARLGDRVILKSSRQPLLDAARILAEGVAPSTRIAMRHAGANHVALRSTVGTAARLTVAERNKGNGPVFEPWKPRPFSAGSPPMRYSGRPPPTPTPDAGLRKNPDTDERPGVAP
jgi:hypothetical protein